MTDDTSAGPAARHEWKKPPDGHELDWPYGLAASVAVWSAFLWLGAGVDLTPLGDMMAIFMSAGMLSELRLTGWRFQVSLVLVPAMFIALTSACIATYTWLTGAAPPEDFTVTPYWSLLLLLLLIFAPLLAFSFAVERAMKTRKGLRS